MPSLKDEVTGCYEAFGNTDGIMFVKDVTYSMIHTIIESSYLERGMTAFLVHPITETIPTIFIYERGLLE